MAPTILYTACVLGGLAFYLLLRTGPGAARVAAALGGLGTLAWVIWESVRGVAAGPNAFLVIFGLIAVASAVRMITHPRPVYTALYFVMVVLSSAALFLLLEAEFMAFALIIVYAGAILITYLFVLMLAQQAPQAGVEEAQPEYDRVPREPAAAAVVGFVMLALLSDMVFNGVPELPPAPEAGTVQIVRLPDGAMPNNIERVGLDLVAKFPVSLELAGVILLMAMFGAVVLARRQIELSEAEKREAAAAAAAGTEP